MHNDVEEIKGDSQAIRGEGLPQPNLPASLLLMG